MYPPLIVVEPVYPENIPMIDGEFDRLESKNTLESSQHEAEVATFYHDTFDLGE